MIIKKDLYLMAVLLVGIFVGYYSGTRPIGDPMAIIMGLLAGASISWVAKKI